MEPDPIPGAGDREPTLPPPAADLAPLSGVPETMLWTLHNRAHEAMRPDGVLDDPTCIRTYEAIAYDYERSFGRPNGSHPDRSRRCDDRIRAWRLVHPDGAVIELGAGLETQCFRLDDGRVRWWCVDVPEAIEVRERLLPTARTQNIARSVTDLAWLQEIDAAVTEAILTAQGLFMYLEDHEVTAVVAAIGERFEHATLVFDTIPPWLSRKTVAGWDLTPHYRSPPMPWGIDRSELARELRRWSPHVRHVESECFGAVRGPARWALTAMGAVPKLRDLPAALHTVTFERA
jgi:O-methyltransferase involved in polyketide biosynthesis